jgi:chromosomal replication initiation ATPase DnaA
MTQRLKTRYAVQKELTNKIKEGNILPAGYSVRIQVNETYRLEKRYAKNKVERMAKKFGTTLEEMHSKTRKRNVVIARAVSATYLTMTTELPYRIIGEVVRDNPDHSSVINYFNDTVPALRSDEKWWPIVNEILYKNN